MPKDTFSKQTPETLKAIAEELRRIAREYDTAAEMWKLKDIEELPVKGETERERVFRGASAFARNAQLAMWEELQRREKYGQPIPPPKSGN